MSQSVGRSLLRTVVEHGADPDFETLAARYRETGFRFVEQYATDAAFNGFEYDRTGERQQVEVYADAVSEPGEDTRLPPWTDAPLSPEDVLTAARADIAAAREGR